MDINLPGLHTGVRANATSLEERVSTLRQVCPHLHIAALSSRPEGQGMCGKAGFDISVLKTIHLMC